MLVNANASAIPLTNGSVNAIITSPPYYGLRDYGIQRTIWGGDVVCQHIFESYPHVFCQRGSMGNSGLNGGLETQMRANLSPQTSAICILCGAWWGSLGLEDSVDQYVSNMALIAKECYRVLHDTGTLWINMGDTYAHNRTNQVASTKAGLVGNTLRRTTESYKPKDLMLVPFLVAMRLRQDGWYLRSCIPWFKPNGMPESVQDRPINSHEYIFLFAKSKSYYFQVAQYEQKRAMRTRDVARTGILGFLAMSEKGLVTDGDFTMLDVATANCKQKHFASFPEKLAKYLIGMSTPSHGVCADCGVPYVPTINKKLVPTKGAAKRHIIDDRDTKGVSQDDRGSKLARDGHLPGHTYKKEISGWSRSCSCTTESIRPAIVLDPFCGTGTTVLAANQMGRIGMGLDLSAEYLTDIAKPKTGENQQMSLF